MGHYLKDKNNEKGPGIVFLNSFDSFCHPNNCPTFFDMVHSRPLILYFHLFNTIDSKQMFNIKFAMTGFKSWTSGSGSDYSTN